MTEQMAIERLSIDEIISHCERKVFRIEKMFGKKGTSILDSGDISDNLIKEYWEHKQVAEYLKEIQQYRAIGTVEELQALKEINEDCIIKHLTGKCSYNETGCSGCESKEKIKVALEKSVAKKVKEIHTDEYYCPACGSENMCGDAKTVGHKYCPECGQALRD